MKTGIFDTRTNKWVTDFYSMNGEGTMSLTNEPFEWKGKGSLKELCEIFGAKGQLIVKDIPQEMKTKHTKGEWIPQIGTLTTSIRDERNIAICEIKNLSLPNEFEANAKLIAEAGTVANETGFTPRQLADQNKKLRASLKRLMKHFEESAFWVRESEPWEACEKALKTPKQ